MYMTRLRAVSVSRKKGSPFGEPFFAYFTDGTLLLQRKVYFLHLYIALLLLEDERVRKSAVAIYYLVLRDFRKLRVSMQETF